MALPVSCELQSRRSGHQLTPTMRDAVSPILRITVVTTKPAMPAIDENDSIWVMGPTDDIINVAGHRLSTGAIEDVLAEHPDIAECAVIGAFDALKGEGPLGLIVLKTGVTRSSPEIVSDVTQMVRERIGPVASFKIATVVDRLPKTEGLA